MGDKRPYSEHSQSSGDTQDYRNNVQDMLRQLLRVYFIHATEHGVDLQSAISDVQAMAEEIAAEVKTKAE